MAWVHTFSKRIDIRSTEVRLYQTPALRKSRRPKNDVVLKTPFTKTTTGNYLRCLEVCRRARSHPCIVTKASCTELERWMHARGGACEKNGVHLQMTAAVVLTRKLLLYSIHDS